MEQTTNFDLKIYEGTDKFNPLTVENANMSAIDAQMKKNQDSGIPTANQLLANSIHSITRDVPSASMFRFTATSRYTTGDSFTVDGVPVTAQMPNGTAVPDGAFIIGSTVLCSLVGQLLTIYSYGIAVADDSEKLGGQLPAYYATKAEFVNAQTLAEGAATLAQEALELVDVVDVKQYISSNGIEVKSAIKSGNTVEIDIEIGASATTNNKIYLNNDIVVPHSSRVNFPTLRSGCFGQMAYDRATNTFAYYGQVISGTQNATLIYIAK